MKKTDTLDDLISQAEAARIRGVSRASINELVKRGRLRSETIAGKVLVYRSDVESFQEEKRGPKADGAG
jgi:excisionase family DNA binding protein